MAASQQHHPRPRVGDHRRTSGHQQAVVGRMHEHAGGERGAAHAQSPEQEADREGHQHLAWIGVGDRESQRTQGHRRHRIERVAQPWHQPSAEEELLGQRGHHDGEDQPAGVDERRGRADARQQQVARERPGAPCEQAQQREMQHRLEQQHQADAQWQELGPPAARARARQEAGAEGQQACREQARRRALLERLRDGGRREVVQRRGEVRARASPPGHQARIGHRQHADERDRQASGRADPPRPQQGRRRSLGRGGGHRGLSMR